MGRTFSIMLLILAVLALGATYTTNYSLYKPESKDTNWGALVNTNFDTIDTEIYENESALEEIDADLLEHDSITESNFYDILVDVDSFVEINDANSIDSVMYVDGSVDHEHLAADVISGMTNVTGAAADYILVWDATDSALKKIDLGEVLGSAYWTDLTPNLEPNDDGDGIQLNDSTGDDNCVIKHDGTDLDIACTGTTQIDIDVPVSFGGTDQSKITEGLVVNDGSGGDEDDDFIVETDNEANAFECDAGDDACEFKVPLTINAADSLTIPQGAGPTIDGAGEIGVDTTSDQFLYYGGAKRVLTYRETTCRTLETPVDADDDIPVWFFPEARTITDVHCQTEGGTSIAVTISDGTNALEAITCDADGADDDGSIANGTFTANEEIQWDFAAPTGTVDWVTICITTTITAD